MTTTTYDPVRRFWEGQARGEDWPWESLTREPEGIEREAIDTPEGLWLRPPAAVPGAALLAIHGGGFVAGSIETHRRMFGHLARAAGVTTLVVEYGLVSDGHVFPSQVDTVEAAYRRLLDGGITRVALVGDSCGATMAARARDAGSPLPASMLLDEFPGQLHTFQMAAGHSAVADDAIGRAGTWLRSTLIP